MDRAILHLLNDQPLAVDLLEAPKPSDIAVICTNLRTIDGKKPVFIDFANSTFVIPMAAVRFIEIVRPEAEAERAGGLRPMVTSSADDESEDLEIDEDFLRRVREA